MIIQAELVVDAQALLGEGAHWDPEAGRLYWVNIEGKQLRIFDPGTRSEKIYAFEQMISAAVPAAGGGWVVALQDGIYIFQEDRPLKLLALVETDISGNRLNDAKCDSRGRLWFGSMSMEDKRGAGSLYVMESQGEVRKVLSGISISNGLAWDDSRGLMYYIDTLTRGVDAMDYDLDSGTVSGRRTVVQFPEGAGGPDGMTIDGEGMIWVAHWNGSCVSRWNPHTGEQTGKIEVPAPLVTSCAFGGGQLDELFITTARVGMSSEELQRWPLAGGLFKAKTGVTGLPGNAAGQIRG
ncbi:SMP-30/gluconolactonase/LRE family protein [Paenibacillus sp. S150]|uniref:SMP-30/gluconolactonase/LRE family protein n=1 Tax=Paenibacillus sp. S150 TaxID=2749826 RepID=UPI001C5A0F0E|nr:SMP-30/gluconolactonase/LRE family protein [Paenibacillus sp. S150]MBW4082973.1 SMP-30/gluconolactonase/LRE family protein [Paenibacillus sp. S150]